MNDLEPPEEFTTWARSVLPRLHQRLQRRAARQVVPIYTTLNDAPAIWGTGALLRVATSHFLVTAAHTLEDLPARPFLGTGEDGQRAIHVRGSGWMSDRRTSDEALFRIHDDDVDTLLRPELVECLSLDDIRVVGRFANADLYFLFGYPASEERVHGKTIEPVMYGITTQAYTGPIKSSWVGHGNACRNRLGADLLSPPEPV